MGRRSNPVSRPGKKPEMPSSGKPVYPTAPSKKGPGTDQEGTPPKSKKPPVSDCGGWGGVSNGHTNNRGGRRGRG